MNDLQRVIAAQQRGEAWGITSICSANAWVLKAAMRHAVRHNASVLIEATCNQVNQFGGYTGMTPAGFVEYVDNIAAETGFLRERLMLGGDHLGPNVWQRESADSAMQKSVDMMRDYVRAGFEKIHLDASMKLGDDPEGALSPEVSARRAAVLAKAAEAARRPDRPAPLYVIGTEVPVPGGAKEHEDSLSVTSVESVRQTVELTRDAFRREGVEQAWERVIAVVVQPGVEFGDDFVLEYNPSAARDLARRFESEGGLVYEAHSTDYQTRAALKSLVRDHFAILKVGPGLTFAFREAVYALAAIEDELFPPEQRSQIAAVLDSVMVNRPQHWQPYYHGTPEQLRFARKYSLSDRIRYYWPEREVVTALDHLLATLAAKPIPYPLLSMFLPVQYRRIREGALANTPHDLLLDKIDDILADYTYACTMG